MSQENLGKILQAQNHINNYRTSHILHLILSIITAGLWIPFWIITAISNSNERTKATRKLVGVTSGSKKTSVPMNWKGLFYIVLAASAMFIITSLEK